MASFKEILKIQKTFQKRHVQNNKLFFEDYYIPKLVKTLLLLIVNILSPIICIIRKIGSKRVRLNKPKYNFSVCAIFKNEELSLKQWIEYHLQIGVEHFYLYNNNSTDNFNEILKPYIENSIVTLVDWPMTRAQQMPAYKDCYDQFKDETRWIAYIDLDEYITPFYETDIKKWISKFQNYPSVYIYWKMFGTSGVIHHDVNKLILEQYISCWENYYVMGKSIINTDYDVYKFDIKYTHTLFGSVNLFGYKIPIPPINEFNKYVFLEIHRTGLFSKKFTIQLNHYYSKSFYEYMDKKRARGDVAFEGEIAKQLKSDEVFYYFQNQCISTDYKIFRFINELKLRMGFIKENGK